MSILSSLSRFFGGGAVALNGSSVNYRSQMMARTQPVELPPSEMYALLRTLYYSAGAYDDLARANVMTGRAGAGTKSIRSPIGPVVSFFGSKTFPDPLTVVTENEAITPAIEQLWAWSNWQRNSRVFAREMALFGECWLKSVASQEKGRVWLEVISPEHVTDFSSDERDFVTEVRLDIPQCDEAGREKRYFTHTEVWSQPENRYRVWQSDGDAAGRAIQDLGTPVEDAPLSAFGISWVPFSRGVFSGLGEKRGIGAVQLALEAVIEADLSATNLHAMLYQDADGQWVATAAGADANGRPIPPLRVAAAEPTFDSLGRQTSNGTGTQADGTISVGKRSFWRLPPGYDLKSVVADIDYTAALNILKDHDEHLEKLLPALAYARISEMSGGDLSGRAMRYKLTAAVDQVMEVRANALAALTQAHMQALTLGQINGIPGFDSSLGSFEAGDFAHEFEAVQVIPTDDLEQAQADLARGQAAQAYVTAGVPFSVVLVDVLGKTEAEAVDILALAEAETQAGMERQEALFGGQSTDQQQQGAAV